MRASGPVCIVCFDWLLSHLAGQLPNCWGSTQHCQQALQVRWTLRRDGSPQNLHVASDSVMIRKMHPLLEHTHSTHAWAAAPATFGTSITWPAAQAFYSAAPCHTCALPRSPNRVSKVHPSPHGMHARRSRPAWQRRHAISVSKQAGAAVRKQMQSSTTAISPKARGTHILLLLHSLHMSCLPSVTSPHVASLHASLPSATL